VTTLIQSPSKTVELSAVDGLAQLSFLIQDVLSSRASKYGLSMTLARLLGVLRDRTPSVNELAVFLDLDKSSVSGLITRAEERGLVERVPSLADGRVVVVRLTKRGRSQVRKFTSEFESDAVSLLSLLSYKDASALASLISRLLVAHAEAHGVDLFA
jgi:MarR family transcriptional regulator, lower aerobic nicotinate degradation pathway regulator